MKIKDYLSIPYIIGMEAYEGEDGDWIRRAEYPEIVDCYIETDDPLVSPIYLLDELEKLKINKIITMLKEGEQVPQPRMPLTSHDPSDTLIYYGLSEYLTLLEKDEIDIRNLG